MHNMNKNTNNGNDSIPQEVLELIPWYVTDTLSVDEKAFFKEALASYPQLQQHIKMEEQLHQKVVVDPSVLDKSAIAPTEERLKSVLNMIDVEEAKTQTSTQNSFADKLKSIVDMLIPNVNGTPQYARVASLGVLVLSVAVLTAFVAPLFTNSNKSDYIPASAVTTQTEEKKNAPVNSASTKLLIGFKGSSVELGNNSLLKGKLAKIESVPDKEGFYQISFKQHLSPAETQKMIDALLAQKDMIWFAGEEF